MTRWAASRSVSVSKVSVSTHTNPLIAPGLVQPLVNSNFCWPKLSDIISSQQQYAVDSNEFVVDGVAFSLVDGVFSSTDNHLWIPEADHNLQLRLLIIAHAGSSGHHAIEATLNALKSRFLWKGMSSDVTKFCKLSLHCTVSQGGAVVPRPFGEAIQASVPNSVIHFDYLYISASNSKLKYLLVIRCDLSSFIDLYPTPTDSPTSFHVAGSLLYWFSRYGVASTWVSDRGSHFLNEVIQLVAQRLHATHHFTLAYCPWSNGSIEIINKHILSVMRALISEFHWPFSDWPYLVPLIRYVLNHTVPANRPAAITLFTGLMPSSPLDSIWNPRLSCLVPVPLSPDELRQKVSDLHLSLEGMHKSIQDKREERRSRANRYRKAAKPIFSRGDFVLVSNVLKRNKSKLSVR